MADVVARIKQKGKNFEVMVDVDKAVSLKKAGKVSAGDLRDILAVDTVFTDYKKGLKASSGDLKSAFGTDNAYEIAATIINNGEILLPQEYREKAREQKLKQIVDFLVRNCTDPRTNAPYTAERILSSLKEVGINVEENKSIDEQAMAAINKLQSKIPIKMSIKKIRITVPAMHTGRVYSLLAKFNKEKEEWLSDGSLKCIIDLPAGMQLEFYDKLNAITHGSALTEEIEQKE